MLLDLQTLRVFVAVAHEGSLTRAAEKMHLTQPAIGLQVRSLHEDTGLQLFSRTPRGMLLTHDGEMLLPIAQRVLETFEELKKSAARLRSEVHGTLAVGTVLDPEFTRLGEFLSELRRQSEGIEVVLQQGMSGEVLAHIDRGRLDAGFYLLSPAAIQPELIAGASVDFELDERFSAKLLTRFIYRVVAPPGWDSKVVGRSWDELAALPWLATPPASVHHKLLASVFGANGQTRVDPARVASVDQEASMLHLVKSGAGLSLIRDSIAEREARTGNLVVADRVGLHCVLAFVCLKSRSDDPIVRIARTAIRRAWGHASMPAEDDEGT